MGRLCLRRHNLPLPTDWKETLPGPRPYVQTCIGVQEGRTDHVEGSDLLVNLLVVLLAALVGAIAAVRLGQSVILGYILAGVAIGPSTPGFVGDIATVQALSESMNWRWRWHTMH